MRSETLLRPRFVHFLRRVQHVFVRFLQRIELGLLFRRQERADLRRGVIDHAFGFLDRFLMDGLKLRFRLVDDGSDLGLLRRSEVELLGQMLERVPHAAVHSGRSTMAAVMAIRGRARNT